MKAEIVFLLIDLLTYKNSFLGVLFHSLVFIQLNEYMYFTLWIGLQK